THALPPHSLRFPYTTLFRSDIGLADPRAQTMAVEAWDTYERLGSPEGDLALAQLVIYLASTAKSNAAYVAFNEAKRDVREHGTRSEEHTSELQSREKLVCRL